jgi:hypothetical protein
MSGRGRWKKINIRGLKRRFTTGANNINKVAFLRILDKFL